MMGCVILTRGCFRDLFGQSKILKAIVIMMYGERMYERVTDFFRYVVWACNWR